jgi:hypothetical protein
MRNKTYYLSSLLGVEGPPAEKVSPRNGPNGRNDGQGDVKRVASDTYILPPPLRRPHRRSKSAAQGPPLSSPSITCQQNKTSFPVRRQHKTPKRRQHQGTNFSPAVLVTAREFSHHRGRLHDGIQTWPLSSLMLHCSQRGQGPLKKIKRGGFVGRPSRSVDRHESEIHAEPPRVSTNNTVKEKRKDNPWRKKLSCQEPAGGRSLQ